MGEDRKRKKGLRSILACIMLCTTFTMTAYAQEVSATETDAEDTEVDVEALGNEESYALTEDELAALENHTEFRIGYSDDLRPLSYTNEDGEAGGAAVSVMNQIAQMAGVEVEYYCIGTSSYINSDIDINLALKDEDSLSYHGRESSVYLELPLMVVEKVGVTDYTDVKIGYMDYYSITEEEIEILYPGSIAVSCENMDDMTEKVTNCEIDFTISTSISAKNLEREFGDDYEVVYYGKDIYLTMTFADWLSEDTVNAFEKLIHMLDVETIATITLDAARLLPSSETTTIVSFLEEYQYLLLNVIVVFVVINMIVLLRVQIKSKKKLLRILGEDELTGLLSMRKFHEDGKKKIMENDEIYSLLAVDIDNFKYVNKVFGYDKGSLVLKQFAQQLKAYFDEDDLIARLDSDKFYILTSRKYTEARIKKNLLELNNKGVSVSDEQNKEKYFLHISAGVYMIEQPSTSFYQCVDNANIARMKEKNSYRNTCVLFTHELELDMNMNDKILASMERGIQNREFTLLYQPKVDAVTKKVVGAEALVRWQYGHYDLLYPQFFIPIFEKNGFITNLDYYVFETVCQLIASLGSERVLPISINLSNTTLQDYKMLRVFQKIMDRYHVNASMIELEIAENIICNDVKDMTATLWKLKEEGFKISMNEFGRGYSSLSQLMALPIDRLKINKVFVDNLTHDKKARILIEGILDVAKKLGVEVIIEGVETPEQLAILDTLECMQYQGFYFYKPMEEENLLELF